MANKTFLELQTALASMWGYESPSDLLDQDLLDIKSYIEAAYFDCYVPVDGTKAYWPEKYHSAIFKAPVSATLGLTADSTVVTGYAFEASYAGSFVKIGEKFYRYGTPTAGPAYALLQAWDGDTGSYAATVYHNAVALPWSVVEMASVPNLLGVGLLAALPDSDAELMLRTEPAFDFHPRDGREPLAMGRNTFRQSAFYDIGDPRYYHIDQGAVDVTFAIGNRLHVYPIPQRVFTVEFKANIVPAALTSDSDIPAVPGKAVDNILLPIAREKLAKNTANRRYTGPNVQLLTDEANRARAQLKSMRRVQRDVAGSVRLKRGW